MIRKVLFIKNNKKIFFKDVTLNRDSRLPEEVVLIGKDSSNLNKEYYILQKFRQNSMTIRGLYLDLEVFTLKGISLDASNNLLNEIFLSIGINTELRRN